MSHLNNVGLRHNKTMGSIMLIFTQFPTVVYGYGNFAILIKSETFSSTPYPIHIRKYKSMDSDIQSKSETAQSIAH